MSHRSCLWTQWCFAAARLTFYMNRGRQISMSRKESENTWGCLTTTSWIWSFLKGHSCSFFTPLHSKNTRSLRLRLCGLRRSWRMVKRLIKVDLFFFLGAAEVKTLLSSLVFCPFPNFPKSVLLGLILPSCFVFCFVLTPAHLMDIHLMVCGLLTALY